MRLFTRLPIPAFKRLNQRGQALVEILIAIGLSAILLPTLAAALVTSRSARAGNDQRLQATALLHSTTEAVRSVRDSGWTPFTTNGTYHPEVSGTSWTLVGGSDTSNGLTRQVVISDARRDSSGAIVSSGGTIDSSTKQVTSTVSWTTPFSSSVSSTVYYQRWQNNMGWTQTSQATFNADTLANLVTTNTADGEVQLATGSTNWATPAQTGLYNIAGSVSGLDVFVSGNYAYVGYATGMAIINITNPASPTLAGTLTTTAAINGIYVSGNYAYLATASTVSQFLIVDISNKAAPAGVSSKLLGDTTAGNSIYVSGNYAFVGKKRSTSSGEFFVVDISNPLSPTLQSGTYETNSDINSIEVIGNYAYLATGGTTRQMTILNVTSKSSLSLTGFYTVPAGTQAAAEIDIAGTTAYMGTASNTSGPEFYTINIANPASPALLGSYEFGGAILSVSVSNGYAALGTSLTSKQYTVLDVSANTPTLKSNFNYGSTINDIVVIGNYAYAANANTTKEFVVIGGGAGAYQVSGTLESTTYDAGASAAYNYIAFNSTQPTNTDVQIQIASNTDNATWNYVGPDGTASTYYTAASMIPFNTLGRYIRYKATLTGNGTVTPILQDVTINYSP